MPGTIYKFFYKFFILAIRPFPLLNRWLWYWKFFKMASWAYEKVVSTHQPATILIPQGNDTDSRFAIACVATGLTLTDASGLTWGKVTKEYFFRADLYFYKVLEDGEILKFEATVG